MFHHPMSSPKRTRIFGRVVVIYNSFLLLVIKTCPSRDITLLYRSTLPDPCFFWYYPCSPHALALKGKKSSGQHIHTYNIAGFDRSPITPPFREHDKVARGEVRQGYLAIAEE